MESTRRRNTAAIIIVLSLCGTVVSLMQTLVVPLLTDLPELLGTTADNASWLVTITLLTSAVATPIISKLADMYGKRRMMLLALGLLVAGSALGALSDSLAWLIVARGLQGFGSALIPVGISVMRDELPAERVGSGVALMSATLGIGAAIGLPLSGVIYSSLDWHAIFWVSAVMGAVMLVAVLLIVPESRLRATGQFDWQGAILLSVALTGLLLGISKGGHWGWGSQQTLLSFLVSALVFGLWAPWELRAGAPLVDLRTSARRPVLLTNVASLLAGFAMFANLLISAQQFQLPKSSGAGFGLSVTQAGLGMLPGAVIVVLLAPVAAWTVRVYGARWTLTGGLAITGISYVLRVFFDSTVAEVVVMSALVSLGTAFAFAAMPMLIMRSVPITETAAANGLNTLVRSIGTSTSSAIIAALLATFVVPGTIVPAIGALHAASWLAAIAALAGSAVGLLIPSGVVEDEAGARGVRREIGRKSSEEELVATGRVVRPDGRAAKLAVVSVLLPDGEMVDWGRADNTGRWSVVIPTRGRYLVVCSAEGWQPCALLMELDAEHTDRTVTLEQRLTVAGVVSRDGYAITDALVVLTSAEGEPVDTTRTDSGGHYALAMPPLGRYILTVLDDETGLAESQEVVITAQRRRFNVVMAA